MKCRIQRGKPKTGSAKALSETAVEIWQNSFSTKENKEDETLPNIVSNSL